MNNETDTIEKPVTPPPVKTEEAKKPIEQLVKDIPEESKAPEAEQKQPEDKSLLSKFTKKQEPKPEAKKEEKPVEPSPEEKIELPATASEESKNGLKVLKSITKELRAKNAEYEAKLKEYESKPAAVPATALATEEYEKLQTQNKQLLDRLAQLDLQSHPDFQREYITPKKSALQESLEILEGYNITDVNLEEVIDVPRKELGKAVAKITDSLPRIDAMQVEKNLLAAHELRQKEKAALQNVNETHKTIQTKNAAKQIDDFNQGYRAVESEVMQYAPELEAPSDADEGTKASFDAYNAARANIRKQAEARAFGHIDEKTAAVYATKSVEADLLRDHVVPMVLRELDITVKRMQKAEAELSAIKSNNPNRSISATPSSNGSRSHAQMSHHEAWKAMGFSR